jgi:hypothetical protein
MSSQPDLYVALGPAGGGSLVKAAGTAGTG